MADRFVDRDGLPVVFCDSCREPVDQTIEPGRFRHSGCPVPPLPDAAHAVFAQVEALRGRE